MRREAGGLFRQFVADSVANRQTAEDLESLQDMIAAAVNDAATESQELAADKMSVIIGGMNIPGLA